MSAPTTSSPLIHYGIIASVAVGRKPLDQRERIEAALAAYGLKATEIVEEDAALAFERGQYGIARVRELAAISSIDMLVVASDDVLFYSPQLVESFSRDMAAQGVRVRRW